MSSRNRRTQGNPDADMFTATNNAPDAPSLSEITHEIYGGDPNRGPLEGKLGKGISANPLPIRDIFPDRRQPRRVIPSSVHAVWDGNMDGLFAAWTAVIKDVGGNANFDLLETVKAKSRELPALDEDDFLDDVRLHPIESSLLKLIDLAASIKRDGLLNPISVVPYNNVYMLETGERRWLAYHLLYQVTGEKQWAKIPAHITGQFSVWRQASENSARDDLNAISRARQFSLLLMDVWQQDGRVFEPITAFEHEQDYYAQVADSKDFRVPYGMNEKLISAMGLTHRSALSEFRAMLRLPHVAWTTADDFNWPRQTLYLLTQLPPGEAEVLVETAQESQDNMLSIIQIALGQDNSDDQTTEKKNRQKPFRLDTSVLESRHFVAGARKVGRAIDMGMRLRDNKRQEALSEIEALRTWLNEAERILKRTRR